MYTSMSCFKCEQVPMIVPFLPTPIHVTDDHHLASVHVSGKSGP